MLCLIPCFSELIVEAGEFLAVSLTGSIEGFAELLDFRAELTIIDVQPFNLGSELIVLVLDDRLALGESRPKPLGLGTGGLKIGGPLVIPLGDCAIARRLLVAEDFEFISVPLNLGVHRGQVVRQGSNLGRCESTQFGADRLEFGRGTVELFLETIGMVPDPTVLALELVELCENPLALADESGVVGLELPVRNLKPVVLDLMTLTPGREAFVLEVDRLRCGLRPGAIALAVELMEARRRSASRIDDGGLRRKLRRGRDEEGSLAFLADHAVSDVLAPNPQSGLTVRTAHDNTIPLARRRERCHGSALPEGHGTRSVPLFAQELQVALLADDRPSEEDAPDLQAGRAVGANGDEVSLSSVHANKFPSIEANHHQISCRL